MQIERLYVFPVKSLKGIEVKESPIDEYGFKHDRIYAIAVPGKDGTYSVLTQRQVPAMARIHTELTGSDVKMSYTKNGKQREARLPLDLTTLPQNLPTLKMELWGLDMVCSDVGAGLPQVNEFFREFLADIPKFSGATVIASKERRPVPMAGPESERFAKESGRNLTSSFQDLYQGTLMATASFKQLEEHVEVKGGGPIHEQSFRMNIVVGTEEPWEEDDWKRISIGGHEWLVDSLCERCSIPAVDQDSGETRPSKQPLPELNRFRILEKGKTPCFGIIVFSKESGIVVRVGDKVEVHETSDGI